MAMQMAVRGAIASPRKSQLATSSSLPNPKPQRKPSSVSLPASTTLTTLLAGGLFAATTSHEAKAIAFSKDQIVSSLTEVESSIEQAQQVGASVFDTTARVVNALVSALRPAIEAALPIAKKAGEEALKLASPVVSEASKQAQEAIQSAGLDTAPVFTAAKTVAGAAQQTGKVIDVAKPIASSAIDSIFSAEPLTLAGSAGALAVAYFLLPPLWSAISFGLRGYQGDLTPAQTLDLVSTKKYVLVDIRTNKDKDKAGIPRLPSNAKSKLIFVPLEETPSKLKGLVKNVKKLEAEIAALKIYYLKRVNKGSNVIILDSYADSAKTVAKTLTSLGLSKCWVVVDGFSGGRGWLQSRLGTDSYNFSFAEVLSPSKVIPAVKRFGTTASTASSNQKLLP